MQLRHNYYIALWAKSRTSAVVFDMAVYYYYIRTILHVLFLFLLYALIVLISLFIYALILILLSAVSLQFALWVAYQAPSLLEGRHLKKYV